LPIDASESRQLHATAFLPPHVVRGQATRSGRKLRANSRLSETAGSTSKKCTGAVPDFSDLDDIRPKKPTQFPDFDTFFEFGDTARYRNFM